jgi:hypothetical protein
VPRYGTDCAATGDGVFRLETLWQAGYADQPHLTRSLKRFVGQTPAQIVHSITSE